MDHVRSASLILLVSFLALPYSQAESVIRLSEPVASDAQTETFGDPTESASSGEAVVVQTLTEVLSNAEDMVGKTVTISTRVGKVCQKKGCFFIAQEGALAVRVSFKDYAFFIPTDSVDKQVTLVGELVATNVSAEQAEHFAQDAGSEVALPGEQYEFVAASIRIPKNRNPSRKS